MGCEPGPRGVRSGKARPGHQGESGLMAIMECAEIFVEFWNVLRVSSLLGVSNQISEESIRVLEISLVSYRIKG